MPKKTRRPAKPLPKARPRRTAAPAAFLRKSQVVFFELDIRIAAAPARVWRALTQDTAKWWPADFLCAPDSKGVKLEAWPGGRLFEEAENGGGLVWFNVVALTPPKSMHLAGHIIPPYGGPATSLLYLSIDRTPSGSILRVHNSVLGYISKSQLAGTIDGWRQLFVGGLKPFAEGPG